MVITSVRKQQKSSKIAAVDIDGPPLCLLGCEIVVPADAMVEHAPRHPLDLKNQRWPLGHRMHSSHHARYDS
jgi:hypothetical protein